jgi:hypothetical protein
MWYGNYLTSATRAAHRERVTFDQDLAFKCWCVAPIESVATWVNSHNARDLQTSSGGVGREDGPGSIDFYSRSRTVHLAADDRPVPLFGA